MSDGSTDHGGFKQRLSALVDGELDPAQVQDTCAQWRTDGAMRSTWHAYHLIGDVLRSEDLAARPDQDESFILGLRARLAGEPVVLAPEQKTEPRSAVPVLRKRTWAAPVAVAAGFVAVVGVLVATQGAVPMGGVSAPSLAAFQPSERSTAQMVQAASIRPTEQSLDAAALAPDLKLIRDVHLERYLAAHKQFDNGAAVSVPGVMLRNAAAVAPER